jgi:DNA invertase Pin-like site-specific DNA recombinase
MAKAKRVAIYYRVSTDDQSVDMQVAELRRYAADRAFKVVAEHQDQASGAKADRPGLKALMADVRQRKVDVVLVWAFDRFARSSKQLLVAVEEFEALGVDFIAYNQHIDTTTPQGKLFFTITAAFAEFERSMISQRVRAGQATAKAKGKHIGRPFKKGAHVKAAQIHELRQRGLSIRAIGKATGASVGTVHGVLKAEVAGE